MLKSKKPIIKFVSKVKGLEKIEECIPKPATKYIPDWFKNIPIFDNITGPKTVRQCPSFPDFFSSGYVIPMWMDSILSYDKVLDRWSKEHAPVVDWAFHGNQQFLDYTEARLFGKESSFVFKTECPWMIITSPGYSVLQLPMFYHFNKEWSVLPGIIDTDIHHEVNQQVLYHGNGEKVLIERGTPFVMYIPYKREDFNLISSYMTKEESDIFDFNSLNFQTLETQGGHYRKMQRDRDKKNKKTKIFCPIKKNN